MSSTEQHKLVDAYLKASDAHRQRLTTLHTNEWQIAIVFWSAIAGSAVVSIANAHSVFPLPPFGIACVAVAYLLAGCAYVLGFCRANYRSLATERKRYMFFQNKALTCLQATDRSLLSLKIGNTKTTDFDIEQVPDDAYLDSDVWRFKVLSTVLSTGFAFATIANLDRIAMRRWWQDRLSEYVFGFLLFLIALIVAVLMNRKIFGEIFNAIAKRLR
jgi:hypothetical protein